MKLDIPATKKREVHPVALTVSHPSHPRPEKGGIKEELVYYDCKVCKQVDCLCFENIKDDEMDRTIMLFEDHGFIKFVDAVSKLGYGEKFSWVRNTEDPYSFYSKGQLRDKVEVFNDKFRGLQMILSAKWLEYLSISSKYWAPELMTELYDSILAILSLPDSKQLERFFGEHQEF